MTGHTSFQEIRDKRRAKFMEQPAAEYAGGPVYSEDMDWYFADLGECVDYYWDDSLSYEDALVFECNIEKAHCGDLIEHIEERWGEEFDTDGNWPEIPADLRVKLEAIQIELEAAAPDVWYPDYKRRLEFDYKGYPDVEENNEEVS